MLKPGSTQEIHNRIDLLPLMHILVEMLSFCIEHDFNEFSCLHFFGTLVNIYSDTHLGNFFFYF